MFCKKDKLKKQEIKETKKLLKDFRKKHSGKVTISDIPNK